MPPDYVEINGTSDPALLAFRRRDPELHPRMASPDAPHGRFIAEGDLVVERALQAGYRLEAVLADVTKRPLVLGLVPPGVPVYVADEPTRRVMTGLSVALSVIAVFHRKPATSLDDLLETCRRLAVVQRVDNPTNLGAIIRSAVALGIDGIVVDRTSADPLARRSARVSMGTVFSVPFARVGELPDDLEPIRRKGFRLFGLTPSASATPIESVRLTPGRPAAVLLGSERDGLTP